MGQNFLCFLFCLSDLHSYPVTLLKPFILMFVVETLLFLAARGANYGRQGPIRGCLYHLRSNEEECCPGHYLVVR